jgi:hypothetical protein
MKPGTGFGKAEMGGFERQQLYGAVILLVTALFVASGYAPASRWRRPLRGAAIGLFILAVAAATAEHPLARRARPLITRTPLGSRP